MPKQRRQRHSWSSLHDVPGLRQAQPERFRDIGTTPKPARPELVEGHEQPFVRRTRLMTQKCGLVAVIGAPNAGKSTLVNALVGQKVAIVSAKAQTTRARLMGIALRRTCPDHPCRHPRHFRAQTPARPRHGRRRLGRRSGGRRHPAGGRCAQEAARRSRADPRGAQAPARAQAAGAQQGRCDRQGAAAGRRRGIDAKPPGSTRCFSSRR